MHYRTVSENMTDDEVLEFWFIKLVGASDEFEFINEKPFDDYENENDNVYIKCSEYDNADNFSFISFTENKSFACFDLFSFIFK